MSNKEEKINLKYLPINVKNGKSYNINQAHPNNYTHGFFKYPAKFIPEIPKWAINKFLTNNDNLVFDPFSGSGTTLLESNLLGFNAIGSEIDPIAKLITEAKTQHYILSDIPKIQNIFNNIMNQIDHDDIKVFIPKINNLNHWFNNKNLIYLGKLKTLIEKIRDNKLLLFFDAIFISIIKPTSNADDTSPKPYVSKKITKQVPDVKIKFINTYRRYFKMVKQLINHGLYQDTFISKGDALNTPEYFQADIAITSPPYINAFDYARTLRLENLWMDTETEKQILNSKRNYVGTEKFNLKLEEKQSLSILDDSQYLKDIFYEIKKVDLKRAYIVKKFFDDMKINLNNVKEHLKVGSVYVIVIGNSVIRKQLIESWKILNDIAQNEGYKFVTCFSYDVKNPYIRIPRSGKGGKIKSDHVLVIKKE